MTVEQKAQVEALGKVERARDKAERERDRWMANAAESARLTDAAEKRALEAEAQAAVLREALITTRLETGEDACFLDDDLIARSFRTIDNKVIDRALATDAGKLAAEVLRLGDVMERAIGTMGWDIAYKGFLDAVRARREVK